MLGFNGPSGVPGGANPGQPTQNSTPITGGVEGEYGGVKFGFSVGSPTQPPPLPAQNSGGSLFSGISQDTVLLGVAVIAGIFLLKG